MNVLDESVRLFSPLFQGSTEAWKWICEVSNGRKYPMPELTEQQKKYAINAGYITSKEL